MFLDRGYARVTMSDIAREAGTAVKTVYASVGTKSDILHTLTEVDMAGSSLTKTLEHLRDATGLESSVAMMARGTRADNERHRSMVDLLYASMASDDGARATWRHMVTGYRCGLRAGAEFIVGEGFVDPPFEVEGVADRLWFCFGPNAWRTLVADCHWTYDDAERTLRNQAVHLLTEP